MKDRSKTRRNLILIALLLFVGIFLFSVLQLVFSPNRVLEDPAEETERKTLVRDGKEYYPRQDITTLLLMGIDESGPVTDSGSYNNGGAADMLALIVFDQTNKSYTTVMINRDTVCEMPVLGIGGKEAGHITQQIALSHTYGNGLEQSCRNTLETVSALFYGIEIDDYMALNMDALSILTDELGGITLTVEDDFSAVDPSIPMGTVTLNGEQALTFVRGRKDVGDEQNTSRLSRHEAFISAFLDTLGKAAETDDTFVLRAYAAVDDYKVTEMSDKNLSHLFDRYKDYVYAGSVSPKGESAELDGHMAFYPDEGDLEEIIFSYFYSEKTL